MNLERSWSFRLRGFSSEDWPTFMGETQSIIPSTLLAGESVFWQGFDKERLRREGKRKGGSGGGGGGGRKRNTAKRPRVRKNDPVTDRSKVESEQENELEIDTEMEAEVLEHEENDENPYGDGGDSSGEEQQDDNDDGFDGFDSGGGNQLQEQSADNNDRDQTQAPAVAAYLKEADEASASDDSFLDLDSEKKNNDSEQPQPHRPDEPDSEKDGPVKAVAAAAAETDQPRQEARSSGHRGGLESRYVFSLPNEMGSLRYYHATGAMVAFCPFGRCSHTSDCRKQSTCLPSGKRSGRPIGLLVAWLELANEHSAKTTHVHSCRPTFEQRKRAREWFMSLPDAANFADFEMAQVGPEAEPRQV